VRALLAAVLVLCATAAGSGTTVTRSVYVDGDSLAAGTAPYLPALLPHWSLRQSFHVGRRVNEGIALLRAEKPLEQIVVSLGTNDDPRRVSDFRSAMLVILSIAGPARCVVWANIVRPPAGGASYDGLNRVLAAGAATRRNLVLVDWQSLVHSHPTWLRTDGVHATAAGYRGRAEAIAAAVKECTARLG
jgi:lysophospholipase L1-like esterase